MSKDVAGSTSATIVVPSYNGAQRLPKLLEALAAQDYEGEWDVLVCLDGSQDESARILEAWRRRLRLSVMRLHERRGVSEVLNRGFDAAVGEVLIRCDDDLTPQSNFVTKHIRWHVKRQDCGVIGLTKDVFPDTPYARSYGMGASERANREALLTPANLRWIHWAANNSIHRSTWKRSGGFDRRFLYGQDSEFGFRLWKSGVEIVIDPDLMADHRAPATSAQRRVRRAFISGASRYMREKVHPSAALPENPSLRSKSMRRGTWGAMTKLMQARLVSPESSQKYGAYIDRVLPVLPKSFSEKAISLLVESAGISGYKSPPVTLFNFDDIKDKELNDEQISPHD